MIKQIKGGDMQVRREGGYWVTSWDTKPAKCRRCGGEIYFTKSAKGKWLVLQSVGCGDENEQVQEFHVCK